MILSLDSNVVIELVRSHRSPVREHFFNALQERHQLMASLIVLHELRFGCERAPDPQKGLANVQTVLFWAQIEALDEADVITAAKLRASLERRGRPIGPYDLLIAGQALAKGWTVVTANRREFDRIEGLNVIDWTAPAD